MNIFYLDEQTPECARMHCNKHIVKMILEYAQILSTAHRVLDGEMKIVQKLVLGSFPPRYRNVKRWVVPDTFKNTLFYEATHINHPSVVWARESEKNYIWLSNLLIECCAEYTYRYNRMHKVEEIGLCYVLLKNTPANIDKSKPFTMPPQAMPDDCKVIGDSVSAYRNYYTKYKADFAKWKRREVPKWYTLMTGGTLCQPTPFLIDKPMNLSSIS